MVKSVLITGANAGLGKEAARQLALLDDTEKIYLGCRNKAKAESAQKDLERATNKSVFEIIIMDLVDLDSVKAAVAAIPEPIEAVIMNAGGAVGKDPGAKTADGVTQVFAVNLLGHVVLLDELLKSNKLTDVAIYAGTEAVRGVPRMGMKQSHLATYSVDEFASIADGTYFKDRPEAYGVFNLEAYGLVKYMAALWMAFQARKYPKMRFVTVSPGGTHGTNGAKIMPVPIRIMLNTIGIPILAMLRLTHRVETGAKRYVDVLNDPAFQTGIFYGSPFPDLIGDLTDQGTIFADLNNEIYQDNTNEAIHRFIT